MSFTTKQQLEYILEELAKRTDMTTSEGKRYYEALAAVIREPYREPYREHHGSCGDPFYACPKSEDYCGGESQVGPVCDCGKDEYDAAIKELCVATIIVSSEGTEGSPVSEKCSAEGCSERASVFVYSAAVPAVGYCKKHCTPRLIGLFGREEGKL
jgi:hypothetical protein